jgi:mercuric ion transport protein
VTGRWFSLGSLVTAAGAAICCLGPLLFSVLGIGTFTSLWILRNLVPYRNFFFALTFFFLGLGFYTAYRGGGRARRLDRVILWTSTILVVLLLGYNLIFFEQVLTF